MSSFRPQLIVVLVVLILLSVCPVLANAAASIALSGVPDRLTYPLPAGSNSVLTARVEGGQVQEVWLKLDEGVQTHIPLARVSKVEYQINLADPRLWDVIRTTSLGDGPKQGSFQVYAKLVEGQTVSSVSVCYAVSGLGRPAAVLRVHQRDQAGEARVCDYRCWCDLERVARLELTQPGESGVGSARAEAAGRTWGFEVRDVGASELKATAELKKCWEEAGILEVYYSPGVGVESRVASLSAIPRRLDLPGNLAPVTVRQRFYEYIPGSNEYLTLQLGDITVGQVRISVKTANSEDVIDSRSVKSGDIVPFKFGAERYTLRVDRLVNRLVGEDYGVFSVSTLGKSEWEKIEHLLALVESSDVTFIREEKEYSGKEAGAHLRRKLESAGPKVATVEEFIDQIASRASTTGEPYQIRMPDGTVMAAGDWLRAQLLTLGDTSQSDQEHR